MVCSMITKAIMIFRRSQDSYGFIPYPALPFSGLCRSFWLPHSKLGLDEGLAAFKIQPISTTNQSSNPLMILAAKSWNWLTLFVLWQLDSAR